jgi:hypothetical protein
MSRPQAAPNRPAFRYADELALVTHLINELERRLAGQHEPRVLRTIPSDHCHLGVLGPRDPMVVQPDPLDLDEQGCRLEAEQTERQARQATRAQAEEEDATEPAVGEAEQVAAEQRGAGRDSTRRPPSSLGFEIVAQPDEGSGEIELTVTTRFCIYTQHFPTFEEERDELGRQSRDDQDANGALAAAPAAPGQQRPVSILEAFVRRVVEVPPIQVRIDPARPTQPLDDGGAV